jgi:hypothetical protein
MLGLCTQRAILSSIVKLRVIKKEIFVAWVGAGKGNEKEVSLLGPRIDPRTSQEAAHPKARDFTSGIGTRKLPSRRKQTPNSGGVLGQGVGFPLSKTILLKST